MIHKPSRVACSPFGCGPGDLKAISGLLALRARMDASTAGSIARARASPLAVGPPAEVGIRAAAGTAAARPRNARRLNMVGSFADDCNQKGEGGRWKVGRK